jgi:hypothetical protein
MSAANPLDLDPDLRPAGQRLLVTCRIAAETDPDLYRSAVRGHAGLANFFRAACDWDLIVGEIAGMVRLHKRRTDVPTRRGPKVKSRDRERLASKEVLVLAALVCEQLWRRPRVALRELLQAIAQVCAAEEAAGTLPPFRVVAVDGVTKKQAAECRENLLDALQLLLSRHLIDMDTDLERARLDESVDLVIMANRDRLAMEIASVSPTLLRLDKRPAHLHVRLLSSPTLLDATAISDENGPGKSSADEKAVAESVADISQERDDADGAGATDRTDSIDGADGTIQGAIPTTAPSGPGGYRTGTYSAPRDSDATSRARARDALRRIVDDPSVCPDSGVNAGVLPYLHTLTGRERALQAAASLGLVPTVRRDWWTITDPSGQATDDTFPTGRRADRQAALALLEWLTTLECDHEQGPGGGWVIDEHAIAALFEQIIERLSGWARAWQSSLPSFARAAAGQLVTAGLLTVEQTRPPTWRTTPGIYLWQVNLSYSERPDPDRPPPASTDGVDDAAREHGTHHRGPVASRRRRSATHPSATGPTDPTLL